MDTIKKEELLERLNANHLHYEVLDLSGREIIVHEATGHTSRKIGEKSYEVESDPAISESVKNTLFTLLIPLTACSEGDIPKDTDEFFWMKDADIESWTRCARKINPQLFLLLDDQEKRLEQFLATPATKEKKSRKRTTSSVPS